MKTSTAMKSVLFAILAASCFAQKPIIQDKPKFETGTVYKQGSFVFRIIPETDAVQCSTEKCEGATFVAVGSSDQRINAAIVEVFYTVRVDSLSQKPLWLHQELTCPVVDREAVGVCNQRLTVPVDAIVMIRLRGYREIESVEAGR